MTLANKISNRFTGLRFTAALAAPALAMGLMTATPASAGGLGGVASLGDIQANAAANIIQVAGRRGRNGRRGFHHRPNVNAYAHSRRKSRRRKRRNAAVAIGLGLLGAAIIANKHYDRKRSYSAPHTPSKGLSYRAAKRKCARVYGEDYVWRTDLVYDGYGDARVCKFVRRAGY